MVQSRGSFFPTHTYRGIVEETQKTLSADYGCLLLYDKANLSKVYATHAAIGKVSVRKNGRTYHSFFNNLINVAQIRSTADIHPDQLKLGIKTLLFIPIWYEDRGLGIINLFFLQRRSKRSLDHDLLRLVSKLAYFGIRNAHAYTQARRSHERLTFSLSMLSHELKTPLSAMHMSVQMIQKQLEQDKPLKMEAVNILRSQSERINRLVSELLGGVKIKPELKPCSLRDIIYFAKTDLEFSYPNRKVIVKDLLGEKDKILADREKMIQVFLNILTNSAKYSRKQSPIEIRLFYSMANFVVEIADQGKGIPKKELSQLFQKFYQGTAKAKEQGMGIGLFISKAIVEAHGGVIEIESKVNEGTTVGIRLPRLEDEA